MKSLHFFDKIIVERAFRTAQAWSARSGLQARKSDKWLQVVLDEVAGEEQLEFGM